MSSWNIKRSKRNIRSFSWKYFDIAFRQREAIRFLFKKYFRGVRRFREIPNELARIRIIRWLSSPVLEKPPSKRRSPGRSNGKRKRMSEWIRLRRDAWTIGVIIEEKNRGGKLRGSVRYGRGCDLYAKKSKRNANRGNYGSINDN